jgi:hypothetical protein
MNKPQVEKLEAEGKAILRYREDAALAIRAWAKQRRRCDKARIAYEANLGQTAKNRYELELDALRVQKDFAIGTLCRIGKRLTVDGFHYKAIPSRKEIRVTPVKRKANPS